MRVTPRDANYTGPGSRFCVLRPELVTAFCQVQLSLLRFGFWMYSHLNSEEWNLFFGLSYLWIPLLFTREKVQSWKNILMLMQILLRHRIQMKPTWEYSKIMRYLSFRSQLFILSLTIISSKLQLAFVCILKIPFASLLSTALESK